MSVNEPGRDVPHTGEAGHARSWLWLCRLGLATSCLLLGTSPVSAQIPAIPVLQNAWMNNGVTVAANGGSSDMGTGYAAALAWAPSSRRLQISLGAGLFSPDSGDDWGAYGARVAVPLRSFASGTLGVSAFAGIGGGKRDSTSLVRVPVGIGAGYRRAIGEVRSVSAYVTPFFVWTRASVSGDAQERQSAARLSVGLDFALTRQLGVTAGYEMGQEEDAGPGGRSAGVFGAALSYAIR